MGNYSNSIEEQTLRIEKLFIVDDWLNYLMFVHWFSCINILVRLGKGMVGSLVIRLV